MTTHGSFPRQIFAGYTPFWVPNFGTKNGRFCWQCLCSSDPYGESMNSNVHKNKSESIQKQMKIGLWVEIWSFFSNFSQKNAPRWKNVLLTLSGRGIGNGSVHIPLDHLVSIVDWRLPKKTVLINVTRCLGGLEHLSIKETEVNK